MSSLDEQNALLRRGLSIHSPISTFSDAERADTPGAFRKIGAGACGVVYAADAARETQFTQMFKIAKSPDYHDQLWNDYKIHAELEEAFKIHNIGTHPKSKIHIPACDYFVPEGHFWFDNHKELVAAAEKEVHFPTCLLAAERILPLPKRTRELLIDKYCLRGKDTARADPANKDCLVRIYLGSLKTRRSFFFSLRNFKLHLEEMVELDLDVQSYARSMGHGMAIIHWAAKHDGRDIEFVLGTSPTRTRRAPEMDIEQIKKLPGPTYTGPASTKKADYLVRTTEMFVIDFNQVSSITMDQAGVDKAVDAAMINDPYLPKPSQDSLVEKQVWDTFAKAYRDKSEKILGAESELPELFLEGLREAEAKKLEKKMALLKIDNEEYIDYRRQTAA